MLDYVAVAENESRGRTKFNIMKVNCCFFFSFVKLINEKEGEGKKRIQVHVDVSMKDFCFAENT